jgi:hypothetical protein
VFRCERHEMYAGSFEGYGLGIEVLAHVRLSGYTVATIKWGPGSL